jgi:U2-associated protein SR140
MEREFDNEDYAFLFDSNVFPLNLQLKKLPDSQYYRWKLYSLKNGDTPYSWRTEPFQMFTDGEFWIPPDPVKDEDDEVRSNPDEEEARVENRTKGFLGQSGQRKLLWLLRRMDSRRGSIARGMAFAIDRSDAAEEVPSFLIVINLRLWI